MLPIRRYKALDYTLVVMQQVFTANCIYGLATVKYIHSCKFDTSEVIVYLRI